MLVDGLLAFETLDRVRVQLLQTLPLGLHAVAALAAWIMASFRAGHEVDPARECRPTALGGARFWLFYCHPCKVLTSVARFESLHFTMFCKRGPTTDSCAASAALGPTWTLNRKAPWVE